MGLRQEMILTNTPVDITIMPLPFVETEVVSAKTEEANLNDWT